jgi:hypothetical protein
VVVGMSHRQRVIPKRQWAEGEWLGSYLGADGDPRNDDRTADEIWEDEQAFARLRQANKQRQATPTRSSE